MIFILGGKGFVGSAFVRYCEQNNLEHVIIGRDNYAEFVGRHCDIFINANGNSKKFLAREQPLAEFDASVRSVRASLVDFAMDYYVHLSSCDVYPDCSSLVTTREDVALDVARQSPYGFHKYLAEQCVHHSAPRWLIVRMGGFVGPGLKKNPIFDILSGGVLWLDPDSELQFLRTDDNARLVFELIHRGVAGEIINVCGQGVISLREVMSAAGKTVQVKPGSPRMRYDVSIEKLSRRMPVPPTRENVLAFVASELRTRRETLVGKRTV